MCTANVTLLAYCNNIVKELKKHARCILVWRESLICDLVWKINVPVPLVFCSFNTITLFYLQVLGFVTDSAVTNHLDLSLPPSSQTELTFQTGGSLKKRLLHTLPFKSSFLLMITIRGETVEEVDSCPSLEILRILMWLCGKCICPITSPRVNNRFYEPQGRVLLERRRFKVMFLTSVQYITFKVITVYETVQVVFGEGKWTLNVIRLKKRLQSNVLAWPSCSLNKLIIK